LLSHLLPQAFQLTAPTHVKNHVLSIPEWNASRETNKQTKNQGGRQYAEYLNTNFSRAAVSVN